MGKKEKRRSQHEERKEEEVEGAEQSMTVEDEEVERKRRKKEKKEKRRLTVASEEPQGTESGGAQKEETKETEEEEEASTKKRRKEEKRKAKRRSEEAKMKEEEGSVDEGQDSDTAGQTNTTEEEDDTFDFASLKKTNSQLHNTTSLAPADTAAIDDISSRTSHSLTSQHCSCGSIDGLHYVTDKTTGKFYGSAFMDFATPEAATAALQFNGSSILGRPIKVGMATGIHAQGPNRYNSKQKNGGHLAAAPVSEKPEGTTTVFLGNLSFDVTEEEVNKMFGGCGDISQVRWVEKEGVFKGCGFVEFTATEATDEAVKLNGAEMMGRPIRVDYSGSGNSSRRG